MNLSNITLKLFRAEQCGFSKIDAEGIHVGSNISGEATPHKNVEFLYVAAYSMEQAVSFLGSHEIYPQKIECIDSLLVPDTIRLTSIVREN